MLHQDRLFGFGKFLVLLLILAFLACKSNPEPEGDPSRGETEAQQLGELDIPFEAKPEALDHFRTGLLLLHSFEYADAREAFKKAKEADPDFAMAYWGEAMTLNHPLWREQYIDSAWVIMRQLGDTEAERLDKTKSGLERDFWTALEILYRREGTKNERDISYADHYRMMYEKYPGNNEVAAFYSLALLGSVPVGRDDEVYGKGARVALSILEENPMHPGALHYAIHSYDDPGHAYLAKEVADRYSEVAPDATHALHMPSHIYVALGRWHDVVRSNVGSWNSSVNRMRDKELDESKVSYHALHWLLYGYLQQGNQLMADSIMSSMHRYMMHKPTENARSYMIEMLGNYVVETKQWDSPFIDIDVDLDSLNVVHVAQYHFVRGLRERIRGNLAGLEAEIDTIRRAIENARAYVTSDGLSMCGSGNLYTLPDQMDIDQSRVMELLLRAASADMLRDIKEAEKHLVSAVELENKTSYSYGPPMISYPSAQYYADWLSSKGRVQDALEQYQASLVRGPERVSSLIGARESARSINKPELAAEYDQKLQEISDQAGKDYGEVILF